MCPRGVFNLVQGDGVNVGAPLAAHPDVDMVSFTGSTRAGSRWLRAAAPTVKRVAQELGGKSANIILDDADLPGAITRDFTSMCNNSGQSCNAPTRMLVPTARMDEAAVIATAAAEHIVVGDPMADGKPEIGPVVSAVQYDRIQQLIEKGIVVEGGKVEVGGPGKPEGLEDGVLRQADRVLPCHQRHDDRPGGDLRSGAGHDRLRGRRTTPSASPTTPPTAWRATSPVTPTAPVPWPGGSAAATCT